MPDLIFRLRITQADINYDHFVTEHIAGDLLPKPRLNPENSDAALTDGS